MPEPSKKDADEVILDKLKNNGRTATTKELRIACDTLKISRATFFRHKKKLLRSRQIEEVKIISQERESFKQLRYVNPNELAAQRDIEYYLAKIDDPHEEIRNRGLDFFCKLSKTHRIAWYFSKSNPKFEDYRRVREFFQNKLMKGPAEVRLQFLKTLEEIMRREPRNSQWRTELAKSCRGILEKIALAKEENIQVRRQAIEVLRRDPDVSLLDLAFHVLEEPLDDNNFASLYPTLRYLLIESDEAQTKKLIIRDKLDELSIKGDTYKMRVRKLLEGAPP